MGTASEEGQGPSGGVQPMHNNNNNNVHASSPRAHLQEDSCEKYRYGIIQMKHQLDATLRRFYFCRVTLHVSGASAHHQEYLKLVQRLLLHVLSLQVSHHISLLGPKGPNKEM